MREAEHHEAEDGQGGTSSDHEWEITKIKEWSGDKTGDN
jgi:hypothetical protein